MNSRRCNACGVEYPETSENFALNKQCAGGLRRTCRKCVAVTTESWRERRVVEPLAEKACSKCGVVKPCTKKHFAASSSERGGRAACCLSCRKALGFGKYRPEYAAKRAVYARKYKLEHPEYVERHKRRRLEVGWVPVLLAGLRGRAKKKGLDFTIDNDFIHALFAKQNGRCYWFDVPLAPSSTKRDPQRPSLDRLDNDKGYTPDNVVLCCMAANLGRSQSSANRFSEFVQLVRARILAG